MIVEDNCTPITASVRNNDARSQKSLRSYFENISRLLETFDTDQAIAEFDMAILRGMHPSNMTSCLYAKIPAANRERLLTYVTKKR